jgi:hypothetical protein
MPFRRRSRSATSSVSDSIIRYATASSWCASGEWTPGRTLKGLLVQGSSPSRRAPSQAPLDERPEGGRVVGFSGQIRNYSEPTQDIRAIMNLWDNSLGNEIQGAPHKDEHLSN